MKKKIYYFALPVIALAIFISGCASGVKISVNNGVEKTEAGGNYEYKVVSLDEVCSLSYGESKEESAICIEGLLNKYSQDGWDLDQMDTIEYRLIFRKK